MNRTLVPDLRVIFDVVEITYSIRLAVLKPLPWEVWGEGENGFEQLIDSYSTFKEAQTDYPKAFSSWKETEFEDCVEHVAPEFEPDY